MAKKDATKKAVTKKAAPRSRSKSPAVRRRANKAAKDQDKKQDDGAADGSPEAQTKRYNRKPMSCCRPDGSTIRTATITDWRFLFDDLWEEWWWQATIVYRLIRFIFRLTSGAFYATIETRNIENMPKYGEPTILAFNHGNSLGDPKLLIRATPRTIRFCAKDSVFRLPFLGFFIRGSQAVPVYRRREHGEKAKEFNKEMYRAVYGALDEGGCLGFAPEGVSRFLPFMAQPLKTGVARIALEAVSRSVANGKPDFMIKVAPVGLTYTHREKFRSDVLVDYGPPLVVGKEWLEGGAKGFATRNDAAKALTSEINDALHARTINAPDWGTLRLAMTAARIHRPFTDSTHMSLGDYIHHLRCWVDLLRPRDDLPLAGGVAHQDVPELRTRLDDYQNALDLRKIKDDHVRRTAARGPLPKTIILWRAVQHSILFVVLAVLAAPGLLMWSPIWWYIKRSERQIMANGPRWNDSVAEKKMLIGFVVVSVIFVALFFFAPRWWPTYFLIGLWLLMRVFEEAVGSARSVYTMKKLWFLKKTDMAELLKARAVAKTLVLRVASSLPEMADRSYLIHAAERRRLSMSDGPMATDALSPGAKTAAATAAAAAAAEQRAQSAAKVAPWYSASWYEYPWMRFVLTFLDRRRKKDWNEMLRLNDHNTMDYVSSNLLDEVAEAAKADFD